MFQRSFMESASSSSPIYSVCLLPSSPRVIIYCGPGGSKDSNSAASAAAAQSIEIDPSARWPRRPAVFLFPIYIKKVKE